MDDAINCSNTIVKEHLIMIIFTKCFQIMVSNILILAMLKLLNFIKNTKPMYGPRVGLRGKETLETNMYNSF